jgi:hypothetical protein
LNVVPGSRWIGVVIQDCRYSGDGLGASGSASFERCATVAHCDAIYRQAGRPGGARVSDRLFSFRAVRFLSWRPRRCLLHQRFGTFLASKIVKQRDGVSGLLFDRDQCTVGRRLYGTGFSRCCNYKPIRTTRWTGSCTSWIPSSGALIGKPPARAGPALSGSEGESLRRSQEASRPRASLRMVMDG